MYVRMLNVICAQSMLFFRNYVVMIYLKKLRIMCLCNVVCLTCKKNRDIHEQESESKVLNELFKSTCKTLS